MNKHAQSIDNGVLSRIYGRGRRAASNPAHFQDLGSPTGVRLALMRHARPGILRKLTRGVYDCPRRDPQLGELSPSVESVANAFAFRHGIRLQPSGGMPQICLAFPIKCR
jgi:hypothetical protein